MDYYRAGSSEALAKLLTRKEGLTEKEAKERLDRYGPNQIAVRKQTTFLELFLKQFTNYLAWLLVFIAIFAFVTGFVFHKQEQIIDGIIISIIVLINAGVGAYQDYKSEKTAEALKHLLRTSAVVIRNNSKKSIPTEELVPGDIIYLEEGQKVPADCRILEANELLIDESMLTGESLHVRKKTTLITGTVPLGDRLNMAYMNTFVVAGSGLCLVTGTGSNTEVGAIAKSLDIEHPSAFVQEVDAASKKISYVALVLIGIVSLILLLNHQDWVSVLMIGSALVIGSIPEGLPAIVTFALSMSSMRLAKRNVLVKRKTLLETLGSVDVICTDKTGTLTQNKMSVKRIFIGGEEGYDHLPKRFQDLFLQCSLLCNEAKNTEKGFVGNAEDIALIDYFNAKNVDIIALKKACPILNLEPFSSEKKFARVTAKASSRKITFSKGAPGVIIKACSHCVHKGKVVPLDKAKRRLIDDHAADFSSHALRTLAFAYTEGRKTILLGIAGMYDRPKDHIQETIASFYAAGIEVKMITGDNINTAHAIAEECGFRRIKAISWNELKDLSAEALRKAVNECNVFARMSPEYKLKIVAALQDTGHRVAITGDGVNDVPALKQAEVGIAMGSGSDIAKEAGDLILMDDDLASVSQGIKEGRTIFSNIRKVINYLLTANLSEVIVVFMSSLIGLTPFLAIQLLWVNFVTDIMPAMALGMDPSHKDIMKKKPTGKEEKLINKRITMLTVYIGIKKTAIMFLVFYIVYMVTQSLIAAQTATFTWLVLSHFVRIAAIRFDENEPLFKNKYLNAALLVPLGLQLLILYTPLNQFFHVTPMNGISWVILVTSIIVAVSLAKIITKKIDQYVPATDRDY